MTHTLIGIDCATQPNNVGLARGTLDGDRFTIEEVKLGSDVESIPRAIASWFGERTLLAFDAPLGWPAPLGQVLATHVAGAPITRPREEMFNRLTDRLIHQRVGKKPLEVGADRIARTAHAALSLLAELGKLAGTRIPLAWEPGAEALSAIEIYPAATLLTRGCTLRGYKQNDDTGRAAKQAIIDAIENEAHLLIDRELLLSNDDALDAAACLVAGADFLRRQALAPTADDMKVAKIEGWIWVRG